jgi:hypothetical protein
VAVEVLSLNLEAKNNLRLLYYEIDAEAPFENYLDDSPTTCVHFFREETTEPIRTFQDIVFYPKEGNTDDTVMTEVFLPAYFIPRDHTDVQCVLTNLSEINLDSRLIYPDNQVEPPLFENMPTLSVLRENYAS